MSKFILIALAVCSCSSTARSSAPQPNEQRLASPATVEQDASSSRKANKSLEVEVTAKRWIWSFTHKLGVDSVTDSELHIPSNRRVKLQFQSEDDLHRFTVPDHGIIEDVIPAKTGSSIKIDSPGTYSIFCSIEEEEDEHRSMRTRLIVHEPNNFEVWFEGQYKDRVVNCLRDFVDDERAQCIVAQGEKLYQRHGCDNCHSVDGSPGTGPTFQGNWGETRSFADGSVGKVDKDFLHESVKNPGTKVRSGFPSVMPTISMTEHDVQALINWMKIL